MSTRLSIVAKEACGISVHAMTSRLHSLVLASILKQLKCGRGENERRYAVMFHLTRLSIWITTDQDVCVSAKMRGELVHNFTTLPESRVFISTDAGSTGLNLQVASILINLDLPWNPAVLEQRIARIYRLGQQKPVQILNLVSKESIEEGMIGKLRFKASMFEGVLDGGDDMVFINQDKFKKFMEDIDAVIRETPEPVPIVDYVDEEEEDNFRVEDADVAEENDSDEKSDTSIAEPENTLPAQNNQADTAGKEDKAPTEDVTGVKDDTESSESSGHNQTSPTQIPRNPQQLINEGMSFLSGLAETLKSPEATKQLIDNIVEVDATTGQTNLKIPVANKEAVANVFQLFSKMFSSKLTDR